MQIDLVGKLKFDSKSGDIAKFFLAKNGINQTKVEASGGAIAQVSIGSETLRAPDPVKVSDESRKAAIAAFQDEMKAALARASYPVAADPAQINTPVVIANLTYLALQLESVGTALLLINPELRVQVEQQGLR